MLFKIVTYLVAFGIPSIFSITVFALRKVNTYTKHIVILMKAQKAQMRAQLLKDYYFFESQGYISDIELQEWQNQYNAYHELVGENGILDDRYRKLLALPNERRRTDDING